MRLYDETCTQEGFIMTLEYMYHHEEARLCYLSTCTIARRHYSDTLVHLQLIVDATVTLELRLGTFTTTRKHLRPINNLSV